MKFIAELVWQDHSADVHLWPKSSVTPPEAGQFDDVFTFGPRGLIRLKP